MTKELLVDYHLDRKIKLSEELEYKNLYSWSLQELNEEGEKVGRDQVPWIWNLYFTASELRYSRSIDIEQEGDSVEECTSPKAQEREIIYAILHPGICQDGRWLEDDTSYSMFGTNRKIKQFGLRISKTEKDSDEKCRVWGCVSYTTEVDFREETTDDTVEIYLSLSPDRFNDIADQIKSQRIDILQIGLGRVSGFYSEWSPSISTNKIKILAASNDQEVLSSEGCKIYPPRLGNVGEFNITLTRRHRLNPKQDLRAIDIDKVFDESEYYEEDVTEDQKYQQSQPNKDSLMLAQLIRNEVALARLRTPVWLIFIVLCILLAKVLL